jgi:hypothetical protein
VINWEEYHENSHPEPIHLPPPPRAPNGGFCSLDNPTGSAQFRNGNPPPPEPPPAPPAPEPPEWPEPPVLE